MRKRGLKSFKYFVQSHNHMSAGGGYERGYLTTIFLKLGEPTEAQMTSNRVTGSPSGQRGKGKESQH